ncbi:MAG: TonB-dependent receptor, partial [Pseudomonadota bacterium]
FSEASGGFDNTFSGEVDEDNFSIKAGARASIGALLAGGENYGDVYFTYSQGYKGPGFNTFYNMGTNDTLPIAPEESDSYEVGYKFNAGSVVFNIAAYTAEIDGFQANNFDNSTGVTITRLTNAGTVETRGIEIDAIWSPIDNLTFTGSIALNDAEIKEFNCPVDPTTGSPPADCTDRSGLDLFFSPDVNYTFGASYETPITENFSGFINGTFAHVDDQLSLLPGNDGSVSPNSPLPSYNQLDINVGLSMYEDRYRLTLIGKNLTDDSFVTTFSGDGFRYQIPREADRYFGVNFRANFN